MLSNISHNNIRYRRYWMIINIAATECMQMQFACIEHSFHTNTDNLFSGWKLLSIHANEERIVINKNKDNNNNDSINNVLEYIVASTPKVLHLKDMRIE